MLHNFSYTLFLTLFARSFGFFQLSPFFKWLSLPIFLRLGLTCALTLLLMPLFLSTQAPQILPSLLILTLIKEIAIGYLIGFVFSFLIESAALAGEIIGNMMGLSVMEIFDPVQATSCPFLCRALALIVATLFFATDAHHVLLTTFYESLSLPPLDIKNVGAIVKGTSLIFVHMFHYALIPFFLLFLVIVVLAIFAKLFPDLPILWIGFPLQLLTGLTALIVAISFFPDILYKSLVDIKKLIIDIFI